MTASYQAQVLRISQRVWERGWMATLKEAGVPEDHPAYINPSKFPSPDPGSSSAPGPSTAPEARSRAYAAQSEPEVCPEADTVPREADANVDPAV